MARGQTGHVFGLLRKIGLAGLQDFGCLARGLFRRLNRAVVPLIRLGEVCRFLFEPRDRFFRVAVQPAFAFDVAGQLGNSSGQGLDQRRRPCFFLGQRVALRGETLQNRSRNRLFLAQGWQGGFGLLPPFGHAAHLRFGLCRGGDTGTQVPLGLRTRLIGFAPAAIQQQAFGMAQCFANRTIPRRLPGLPGQRGQLRGQLFDHIIYAGEVLLRPVEFQLGLMAALIQARDASGLFQNAATALRLGVNQLGNLPLPHQSGAMRPGRGIGEKHLHIAGAHILAVHLIGAADIAGDPAYDFKRVLLVKPRRRQPVTVVEVQRHLGEVACGPGGGSGEDHIFHAAAAHGGRAVFAHHPSQRFEQVGFATAVRPHDPGQPVGDDEVGRVHKAFEAG